MPSIIERGLLAEAQVHPRIQVDIGDQHIKEARRVRTVGAPPGGVVADYAPFYFNPRSPMQSSIVKKNVATYQDGNRRLVFLRSTTQRLQTMGLTVVYSDMNARAALAQFTASDDLDDFIDWEIVYARYWNDYPDGRARRHAECLVHGWVPWDAFEEVGVANEPVAAEVRHLVQQSGAAMTPVNVRPGWYF